MMRGASFCDSKNPAHVAICKKLAVNTQLRGAGGKKNQIPPKKKPTMHDEARVLSGPSVDFRPGMSAGHDRNIEDFERQHYQGHRSMYATERVFRIVAFYSDVETAEYLVEKK